MSSSRLLAHSCCLSLTLATTGCFGEGTGAESVVRDSAAIRPGLAATREPTSLEYPNLRALTAPSGLRTGTPTLDPAICGGFGVSGGVDEPAAEVPHGNKLQKYVLTTPDAMCNDGSPAIVYARASTTGSNDWVIFLQGGGHCSNYDDCFDRFCGVKHDAAKMSSAYAPAAIGAAGIFADSGRAHTNKLADANQVFAYYCSSDQWQGRTEDASLMTRPGSPDMSLHFRGRTIFDDMIHELVAGISTDAGPLPSLGDAESVLLTGSSAGSDGVKYNLDHLAQDLLPDKDVRGVFDAGFGPVLEQFPFFATTTNGRDAEERAKWNKEDDADCFAFHSASGDAWKCADGVHVAMNHVTTPFFVRQDLQDSNVLDGMPDLPFAQYTWDALNAAANLRTLTEDSSNPVALDVAPGVFGPTCERHEGIVLDHPFFDDYVGDERSTYHALLLDWLDGKPAVGLGPRPTSILSDPPGCF